MSDFKFKFHPKFFNDLNQLNRRELEIVDKKIREIKGSPLRFKRLRGKDNCFSVRSGKLRIIYYVKSKTVWFLMVDKRKNVYDKYQKRLYEIKIEFD